MTDSFTYCDAPRCGKMIVGTIYHCSGCSDNFHYECLNIEDGKAYCPNCGYCMG